MFLRMTMDAVRENSMRTGWVIGLAAGITVAVVILLIQRFAGTQKDRFDERQIAARGIAYRCGFFTLMIYETVYSALNALNIRFADDIVGPVLGIFPALAVFGAVAVAMDAYFKVNESKKSTIVWSAAGLLWTIVGISRFLSGQGMRDGLLTVDSMQFFLGMTFLVIGVTQLIHRLTSRGEDDGE